MRRGIIVIVSTALASLAFSSVTQAQSSLEKRLERLRQQEELAASEERTWREQHSKLLDRLERAEKRVEKATSDYSRVRRTRRTRGRTARALRKAKEDALAEADKARAALDEFYEAAHRAEVPPGWLRTLD